MLIHSQSQALRPLTTAHLAQTMTLLGLSAQELRQKIESELASNPALELVNEVRCPTCHRRLPEAGPCPICSRPTEYTGDQPIVFVSPRRDFQTYGKKSYTTREDEFSEDDWAAEPEDLPTYVLKQIATELEPDDRPLAAHILTSLDEDGLLSIPIVEVARYHHVPLSRVEKVLQLIQRADPIGVASPSPKEALLVQLSVLAETQPVPPLTARAIEEGMNLLSRHAYVELGRSLGVSGKRAQELAKFIAENLNPYPGRAHWGDMRQVTPSHPVYRNPDVVVNLLSDAPDSPLVVEIVSPFAGSLRVSTMFKKALAQAPNDKVDEWQSDLDQASLLVKCLQQRNNTLVRLMERLVVIQREFILKGDAHLIPVTRATLAKELDVHESTVSRAVSSKSIQLPNRRIVPIAKMFDRSLHIRATLRQIIAHETQPLSDTQISSLLKKKGYKVARRTVAKYRSMEGILSARFRQPAT
jgi:RNA polymerase sigma-54 factor